MSEQPPEQAPAPPAVPEPTSDEPTVKELASKVDRILGILGSGVGGQAEAEPPSIKAEVQAELGRLRKAEQAKAEKDAEHRRVADLEDKVKKVTEKPPREYRKATRFMQWAGEDE